MTRPLTIRLDSPDFARLEREAKRLGMRPGTLARVLLHDTLSNNGRPDRARISKRLAALDDLLALSAGKPRVDALALLHAAREDLGEQPA